MSEINTLAAFYAFSGGALWLLGSLLFIGFDKTNTQANRWLGAFYCILACAFTQLFLEGFGIGGGFFIHLLELPRWAMLPCLYMAVNHYVSPSSLKKDWLLHFVPFLLFLIFSLVYLMPDLFNGQNHLPVLPPWIRFIVRYFFFGQTVYYWIVCFFLLRRHQKNLKMVASFTEKIDLEWLRYLLISVLFLIFVRILSISNIHVTYYSPILYFLGIILLAYLTLSQKSIYATETYPAAEKSEITPKKALNERLTPEQVEELKHIVMRKTVGDKLYLDPSLTLSALSDKIGISTHELSYILNNGVGKNFYQFINELRTEEAKSLLLSEDTRHLDMLGVAIRAGFNSKTTFYTTFKKATNLTPKEYIKANSAAG
ncbi:AraC family transcriptional regulator [Anseongella ginsenosidimutans]|uniref:AraC family transcriptional regulator n=1 Tax=Anseongella ginsenosidimutans TaxID=496056 RepID=A0A4R3KKA0_9SPHI|nr:helix-turn-helix domain-containing protein [Anseongella ginsenosidimutans]QEC53599.1 AraC family transcriptional regulator [Anseongella ginsenosidimutans]TCS83657.1 AraC family transcriptional regulator [Anseongella ginsenosidimutans]